MLQPLAVPALPDRVYFLFRRFQDVRRFAQPFLYHSRNFVRGYGDAPEHRLVQNNTCVFHHIGGRRRDFHQLEQIVPGHVFLVQSQNPHLFQHRDRVNGFGIVKHGVDGFKDLPILGEIEIVRFELFYDLRDTVWLYEHRP